MISFAKCYSLFLKGICQCSEWFLFHDFSVSNFLDKHSCLSITSKRSNETFVQPWWMWYIVSRLPIFFLMESHASSKSSDNSSIFLDVRMVQISNSSYPNGFFLCTVSLFLLHYGRQNNEKPTSNDLRNLSVDAAENEALTQIVSSRTDFCQGHQKKSILHGQYSSDIFPLCFLTTDSTLLKPSGDLW